MRIRTRKLFGTIALLLLLAIYLPVAMVVGANHFAHAGVGWQVLYFLSAGILWLVPAGALIRWMVRPGPESSGPG